MAAGGSARIRRILFQYPFPLWRRGVASWEQAVRWPLGRAGQPRSLDSLKSWASEDGGSVAMGEAKAESDIIASMPGCEL